MNLICAAWAGCLLAVFSMPSQAEPTWLTLVGDPSNLSADYIEFDPASLTQENDLPVMSIRVSRALPRTSKEGIVFRSFESVVAVDCKRASARFLRASFYAEPGFKGTLIRTVTFGPTDVRPMAFREIQGAPTQRVVRAACEHSAVKSLK